MAWEHLWATWRGAYVTGSPESRRDGPPGDGTLFQRILALADETGDDRSGLILARTDRCFVLLNRFPYTSGHLLVLPKAPVAELEDLADETHTELWRLTRTAVAAQKLALGCHAVNVGVNLGAAAGGSLAEHLHVHCVPRWVGDTNFTGTVAEVRMHSVGLEDSWDRLVAVWEEAGSRWAQPGSGGETDSDG
jgi:ATP adenylyltransferase